MASRPKTVLTLLKRARKFLETHNWGKQKTYDPFEKSFCVMGAVEAVAVGPRRYVKDYGGSLPYSIINRPIEQLIIQAENALDNNAHSTLSIVGLNDRPDTTKEDVLSVFDQTIEILESARAAQGR